MVRSVSWLTLQPLFATAATSRRAKAQMRRELEDMADRLDDALDEVHSELRSVQGEFARLRAIDSALDIGGTSVRGCIDDGKRDVRAVWVRTSAKHGAKAGRPARGWGSRCVRLASGPRPGPTSGSLVYGAFCRERCRCTSRGGE